jgi:hypothetical protein
MATSTSPLRIVLCHAKGRDDSDPNGPSWGRTTARELDLALFGDPGKDRSKRWEPLDLAAAVPLRDDVAIRTFVSPPAGSGAKGFLDEVLHTIIVVLVDDYLLADSSFLTWLADCLKCCGESSGCHRFVTVVPGSETKSKWIGHTGLGLNNLVVFSELGEEAERLDWLALRVLDWAMRAAATGAGEDNDWKIRLFVSHAKIDGLPLAKALRDLVKHFPWLGSFYDGWDLDPSRPWEVQLEESVASSVVVALRTDIYDHRPWCQAEVLWAEQHGSPLVLVDARGGLVHAASCLPFESAPCVRIPDGNLVRILHAALRVALRARIFLRRVAELQANGFLKGSLRLIPASPGLSAIAAACNALEGKSEPRYICHPDPGLRGVMEKAADALAATVGARIVTPRKLVSAPEVDR